MDISGLSAGEKVRLRTLEPGDLEYLYRWENDLDVWQYGDCGAGSVVCSVDSGSGESVPVERFSRGQLHEFIENQRHGFHLTQQLRLVICRKGGLSADSGGVPALFEDGADPAIPDIPVGFIDLFDFDAVQLTAGVGILICDSAHRRKGYGGEALRLLTEYARCVLGLRELWCSVARDNDASASLFSGAGFVLEGVEHSRCRIYKKTLAGHFSHSE